MLLADAKFMWLPVDREIYEGNPWQGKLEVVTREEDNDELMFSFGSTDHDWNEAPSHAARVEMLQQAISHMVWVDGLQPITILAELTKIEDLDVTRINFDKRPEPDEDD